MSNSPKPASERIQDITQELYAKGHGGNNIRLDAIEQYLDEQRTGFVPPPKPSEPVIILPAKKDGNVVALNFTLWQQRIKDHSVFHTPVEIIEGVTPEFTNAFFEYRDGQLTKITHGLHTIHQEFEERTQKAGYRTKSQDLREAELAERNVRRNIVGEVIPG